MKTEKIKTISRIGHSLLIETESGKEYFVCAHGGLSEYSPTWKITKTPFTKMELCSYVLCHGDESRAEFEKTFPELKPLFPKAEEARAEERYRSQLWQINDKLEQVTENMRRDKDTGMDKIWPEHWFSMIIQKEKLELEKKNLAKPNKS